MSALNIIVFCIVVMTLAPILVYSAECLLALFARRDAPVRADVARPSIAVLIPAHDEQAGIAQTIEGIKPQLAEGDRLIVVADNCTDNTASVARSAGATVIERTDPDRCGKGHALDFGLKHLADSPPEVVFFVDADCRLIDGSVDRIAREVAATGRPVQGSDLLDPPPNPRLRDSISSFAFTVKNLARPLGLRVLGLPCPLMGTGMALPWELARTANLASGNIVEDMQLGVDLAIAGHPARLCVDAGVRGVLASGAAAAKQRRRWEHGHIRTLLTQAPRLMLEGLKQRRLDLLAMALDLSVPPLSLLVLTWALLTGVSLALWLGGGWVLPFILMAAGGGLLATAVFAAWARFARHLLPLHRLLAAPFYALWKLPLYVGFIFKRERNWVRSERAVP